MSIQSGVPFSTTYNAKLGVAGGMNFTKADTEVKDNSVDAGATYSNSKNMIRLENGQQVQYTAYWDNGSGTDPLHPYGLAKTMPTKESDDTIGTFHSGFVSFVAFHKPEQVYIESISSGKFGAVTFKAANLVKDYNDHPHDVREASVADHMERTTERPGSKVGLLQQFIEHTTDPLLKSQLQAILDNIAPQYTLILLKHRVGYPSIDALQRQAMASVRLCYHDKLKRDNLAFAFEDAQGRTHIANAETAIDPLGNRKQFPVLELLIEIKRGVDRKFIAEMTISNASNVDKRTVYLHYSADKRYTKPQVHKSQPSSWVSATPVIRLRVEMNAVSGEEARKQLDALTFGEKDVDTSNSEFNGVDDLRGIFVKLVHRILGRPYWNTKSMTQHGYGHTRNGGHPRCVMSVEGNKKVVTETMHIHANKHTTNLNDVDPFIQELLYRFFGTMVHGYTSTTLRPDPSIKKNPITENGKTTPWDLDEFVAKVMQSERSSNAPTLNTTAPAPSTMVATTNLLLTANTLSVAKTPIIPVFQPPPEVDITFSKTESHVIVSRSTATLHKIPYRGQFHVVKDFYEQHLFALGPARFLEWIVGEEVNANKYLK